MYNRKSYVCHSGSQQAGPVNEGSMVEFMDKH